MDELLMNEENKNVTITIPRVERKCWMTIRDEHVSPCPYSYEHSKMLMMNGCPHPFNEEEFSSLLCRGCMETIKKFAGSISEEQSNPFSTIPVTISPTVTPPKPSTSDLHVI